MRQTTLWDRWWGLDVWLRAGLISWAILTAAVSARAVAQFPRNDVSDLWRSAGLAWIEGRSPYDDDPAIVMASYRYGPLVTCLFTPLTLFTQAASLVAYRVLMAAAFVAALIAWLRLGVPRPLSWPQIGVCLLLTAPLAQGNINNGQSNLVVLALLLACATCATQERWLLAGLFVGLAAMIKVYPLALGLLLVAAYPRRFGWKLPAALILLAAAPFLAQSPSYVWASYENWAAHIGNADSARRLADPILGYRDVWFLLRVYGTPVTLKTYAVLQVGGALMCAGVVVSLAWRGVSLAGVSTWALLLTCVWSLLLGPAPETSTYVLIAPSLVHLLVSTFDERRWASFGLVAASYMTLFVCALAGAHRALIETLLYTGTQPIALFGLLVGLMLYAVSQADRSPARGEVA